MSRGRSLRSVTVVASIVRPTFLVERYAADLSVDELLLAGRRAEEAAPLLAPGSGTRYLGSILLPSDEMALCLFEGTSEEVVRAAVERAALAFDRITPAVRVDRRSRAATRRSTNTPPDPAGHDPASGAQALDKCTR